MSRRLFDLVNKLEPAERRYVKLALKHNSYGRASILLQFFDYMLALKKFDKRLLLEKCKFLKASQYQNVSSRLYKSILTSLRSYNSDKFSRVTILELAANADILIKKGLFNQAIASLRKSEKLAAKYELDYYRSDFLEQLEWLLVTRSKSNNYLDDIKQVQLTRAELENKRFVIHELKLLKQSSYNLFLSEGRILRDEKLLEPLWQMINKFEKNHSLSTLSKYSQTIFYRERSFAQWTSGNFKASFKDLCKIEDIYKENPEYKELYPRDYLRFINNKTIVLNLLGDFIMSEANMVSMEGLLKATNHKEIYLLVSENVLFHRIEIHLLKNDFKEAYEYVENNLEQINSIKNKLHSVNQYSKYYRIALSYFGSGHYREALKWVNEIIIFNSPKTRKDIITSTILLKALIHFQMGKYELLKTEFADIKNQLVKIDRWLKPEQLVFQALEQVVNNKDELSLTLKNTREKLKIQFDKNPLDKYFFSYFDVIHWINSSFISKNELLNR